MHLQHDSGVRGVPLPVQVSIRALMGPWYVLVWLNWRRRKPRTLAVTRDGFDAGNRRCGAD